MTTTMTTTRTDGNRENGFNFSLSDLPANNTEKYTIYHTTLDPWSNKSLDAKVGRAVKYVKENSSTFIANVPGIVGGSTLSGALLGAGIGAGIGFVVAHLPGCATGAVIGAIAGASLGMAAGTTAAILTTKYSYIPWKRFVRYNELYSVLFEMQKNNKYFDDMTCPLTLEIFENPVMTVVGITYEKKDIEDNIKKNNGKMPDPYRTKERRDPTKTMELTLTNLYPDHAMRGFIMQGMEKLIEEDLKILTLNADDLKTLQIFLQELRKHVREAVILGRTLINSLWQDKVIEDEMYLKYNDKLSSLVRKKQTPSGDAPLLS